MGRQHRAHLDASQHRGDGVRIVEMRLERADRMAEGAGTGWCSEPTVVTSAARLVHVLGDVGEQREPAEGAYDVHGDVDVDTVEQPAEFAGLAPPARWPVTALSTTCR